MFHRTSLAIAVAVAFLCCLGVTDATAGVKVEYHWDRETGTSRAVVTNSASQVMVEFPWVGALPRSYGAGEEEVDIPTFVKAQLRDLLEDSVDPEAGDALNFVRQMMGPYADTSIDDIPVGLSTWIGSASYEIVEWCGSEIGSGGECVPDNQIGTYSTFCRGFVCKGTTVSPSP